MAEQLALKQLSQYTFATDERLAKWNPGQNLTRSQLSLRRSIIVTAAASKRTFWYGM